VRPMQMWRVTAIAIAISMLGLLAACKANISGDSGDGAAPEMIIEKPGVLSEEMGGEVADQLDPALATEQELGQALEDVLLPEFIWRVKSDLPYNFLIGELSEKLLIGGHDGGFSGMHDYSNLYALNRETGEKLWQVDYGFNLLNFLISEDEKSLVYLEYDANKNNAKQSFYRLSAIDTNTGNMLWDMEIVFDTPVWNVLVSAAQHTVQLLAVTGDEAKKQTILQGYDMISGKRLWEKEFEGQTELRHQHYATPVLLVQKGGFYDAYTELQGLDAATGRTLWTMPGRKFTTGVAEQIQEDLRNFTNDASTVWTLSENSLILVDAAVGKELLELPFNDSYYYSRINEQFLLQLHATDGEKQYNSNSIVTSFIDLKSGKPIWSIDGRVYRGDIDDNVLYAVRDRELVAIEWRTGEIVWTSTVPAELVTVFGDYLYVKVGTDVIVLSKEDGFGGELLRDTRIDHYIIGDSYYNYGLMTNLNEELYIGSMDGTFTRLHGW
jgi:outer membrane protein assembly factor BamB